MHIESLAHRYTAQEPVGVDVMPAVRIPANVTADSAVRDRKILDQREQADPRVGKRHPQRGATPLSREARRAGRSHKQQRQRILRDTEKPPTPPLSGEKRFVRLGSRR